MIKPTLYSASYSKYIAYFGEDFHIVRNNTPSKLSLAAVFKAPTTSDTIVFEIDSYSTSNPNGFNLTGNQYTYEGIVLNKTTGEIHATQYLSSMYTLSNHYKLFSVIVKVTITTSTTTIVFRPTVYIHDTIDSVWLAPAPIIIYSHNMSMRPTVFAKFSDINAGGTSTTTTVCNISTLPDYSWSLSTAAQAYLKYSTGSSLYGFLFINPTASLPTTNPVPITNGVTVTLPAYLNSL